VEARAALVEREGWMRVSRVEAESTVALAPARGEVEDLARRIAFLKGKLAAAR
jgi:chromosome segregation ATPase